MMEKERAEAIDALGRIHNYCEEIDHHCPEEQRTGYKMYPDVMKIFDFLYMNVSDLTKRDTPMPRWQTRCGVCDLELCEIEFGTVEVETNEQLHTHFKYCPRCGQRIDWEHDDVYDRRSDDET